MQVLTARRVLMDATVAMVAMDATVSRAPWAHAATLDLTAPTVEMAKMAETGQLAHAVVKVFLAREDQPASTGQMHRMVRVVLLGTQAQMAATAMTAPPGVWARRATKACPTKSADQLVAVVMTEGTARTARKASGDVLVSVAKSATKVHGVQQVLLGRSDPPVTTGATVMMAATVTTGQKENEAPTVPRVTRQLTATRGKKVRPALSAHKVSQALVAWMA